jgi:hypothetical protein
VTCHPVTGWLRVRLSDCQRPGCHQVSPPSLTAQDKGNMRDCQVGAADKEGRPVIHNGRKMNCHGENTDARIGTWQKQSSNNWPWN